MTYNHDPVCVCGLARSSHPVNDCARYIRATSAEGRRSGPPRNMASRYEKAPRVELTTEERKLLAGRPKTRADCVGQVRPCPWMGCRHHLALEISPHSGKIKVNFPDVELEDMAETCALDVAERGGESLDIVGRLTNLTRERIRQIEGIGLRLLARNKLLAQAHR